MNRSRARRRRQQRLSDARRYRRLNALYTVTSEETMEVWDLRTSDGRYLYGYSLGRNGIRLNTITANVSLNDPDLLLGWDDGWEDNQLVEFHDE